ncbi:MAG: hypothetical protein Q8K82_11215 [Gemmatimonadaceae bacterium]|nr:hypothetical protein [Gemmatimonadaceae bacterium]
MRARSARTGKAEHPDQLAGKPAVAGAFAGARLDVLLGAPAFAAVWQRAGRPQPGS